MQIISTVDTKNRYYIRHVEFVGLKPLRPKQFSVELWISMINDLGASLFLDWHPERDSYDIDLEGEIPLKAIPEFAIDFRCFNRFDDYNDDPREIVARSLRQVLVSLKTTKVIIARKGKKFFATLVLGSVKMKAELDPGLIDHIFEVL